MSMFGKIALFLMFMVCAIPVQTGGAIQETGDDCLSALPERASQNGVPIAETVEIFGCRQLVNGDWATATILDTREFRRIVPKGYDDFVSDVSNDVRADIRAMLASQFISYWFTYDIDSGWFESAAMVSGADAKAGKTFRESLKGQPVMDRPDWWWALRDEWNEEATSYLLDPSNSALTGYVVWYANRRDAAIIQLSAGLAPFAVEGFQRQWDYNQIPQPWQLADAYTIESFALNAHDIDAVMALMTDDCIFENTWPAPDGERYEGQSAVRAFWEKLIAGSPSAFFELEELFAVADRAAQRWRYTWVDADGNPGHIRGIDLFRVTDGKVAEKLAYVKG